MRELPENTASSPVSRLSGRDANSLGATLYMPVINPNATRVFMGEDLHDAGSVVMCLEDALGEHDVLRGMECLREQLLARKDAAVSDQRTMIFVRPRHLGMAHQIAEMSGMDRIAGMIVPKMTVANGPGWFELAREHGLTLMPTFETAEYFDPLYVSEARSMLDTEGSGHVLAIRIGGNDLLNVLGLRRSEGVTSYEGPLGYVLGMLGSQLMAGGYAVAAPVFDIIGDLETLAREVAHDVRMGFVGKTAIHPSQISIIHDALKVPAKDVEISQAILADSPQAVFQIGGVMCEPATHRNWARRVMIRSERWGVDNLEM